MTTLEVLEALADKLEAFSARAEFPQNSKEDWQNVHDLHSAMSDLIQILIAEQRAPQ